MQEEAVIINAENPGDRVKCTFRPKEVRFSKQNNWTPGPVQGNNVPALTFGGGGNAEMRIQLFFDTSLDGSDVRKETAKLWKMMLVSSDPKTKNPGTGLSPPPKVWFQWGKMQSFKGVIESMDQNFVLFRPDGTPIRAVLDVAFKQWDERDAWVPQNPTSRGVAGYRMRIIAPGETLDLIAYQEYGNSGRWRQLADANGITDPLRLRVGDTLAIPPLW